MRDSAGGEVWGELEWLGWPWVAWGGLGWFGWPDWVVAVAYFAGSTDWEPGELGVAGWGCLVAVMRG
jgi:hypothetical protein